MSFLLSLMFSLQQNQRKKRMEQVLPGRGDGSEGGNVVQTMRMHVSKCKNDKIKEERKKYEVERRSYYCLYSIIQS
jgi:hypothetical protein